MAPVRILLVEDTRFFATMVSAALSERLGVEVVVAGTLAEARAIMAAGQRFQLGLADLVLPDARDLDVVSFFSGHGIPSVVFTGVYDDEIRQRLLGLPVIDTILKNMPGAVDHLVWLVGRFCANRHLTALVVEDSGNMRRQMGELLKLIGLSVIEAADGAEGLVAMAAHPEIRLVVTDFEMPHLDGMEMVRRIRADHPRDRLPIIGLSGSGDAALPARFLKYGANDFMGKPFLREEFILRVAQNLDLVEHMAALRDLANRDFLTGLATRRSFFEQAARLIAKRRRIVVGLLDLDFFKRINDTHGHDAGDAVLKEAAAVLEANARPGDVVARFGGEEFCILAADLGDDDILPLFERVRTALATTPASYRGKSIPFSASIGVAAAGRGEEVDMARLLSEADRALYAAKENGRNRTESA